LEEKISRQDAKRAKKIVFVSREWGGLGDLGGFARKNIPDQS
jgi:hypothetical protein